ncbi:hypothetical protein FRX31_005275 [Thalictrum thalictroides]|uniref:Ribonuclease H1 N-terminal domain-containing protein n=1 Tax=Thalictrum thalictroides TaxID=46969 RepID=A0A7J6X8B8_THATH|nr:hypothetical protein FRX31_005275 [Thalictrum thalictroides]
MVYRLYIVRRWRVPGIYTTWVECKEKTDFLPGCDFQSTDSFEHARQLLFGGNRVGSLVGRAMVSSQPKTNLIVPSSICDVASTPGLQLPEY